MATLDEVKSRLAAKTFGGHDMVNHRTISPADEHGLHCENDQCSVVIQGGDALHKLMVEEDFEEFRSKPCPGPSKEQIVARKFDAEQRKLSATSRAAEYPMAKKKAIANAQGNQHKAANPD